MVFLMAQNNSIGKKVRIKRSKSNMHSRIAPFIFPLEKSDYWCLKFSVLIASGVCFTNETRQSENQRINKRFLAIYKCEMST